MNDSPELAFDLLTTELLQDPDHDVSATATGLHTHGKLFAYLDRGQLFVDLPTTRAADLIDRGVATATSAARTQPTGVWVRVAEVEDWPELAAEAHQFVGEPAVGMDS
ncbi:hypothetical protein [Leifsonia shinshuensis]